MSNDTFASMLIPKSLRANLNTRSALYISVWVRYPVPHVVKKQQETMIKEPYSSASSAEVLILVPSEIEAEWTDEQIEQYLHNAQLELRGKYGVTKQKYQDDSGVFHSVETNGIYRKADGAIIVYATREKQR